MIYGVASKCPSSVGTTAVLHSSPYWDPIFPPKMKTSSIIIFFKLPVGRTTWGKRTYHCDAKWKALEGNSMSDYYDIDQTELKYVFL